MNKTTNIIMIAVAAVVLVALNVGVFMAAGSGAISPINNMLLWGGFVVLNVASILWAVSLLGLQPLVVSLSYVAGAALAFVGVRNMGDVSVAEITTAGATYGAFGALAVGNATTKVRLAFFNKGQVPFIFIIIGLLVIDAGLNSQVSSAGLPVLLNAVALPFIVAGTAVGSVWSVMNRFGIGTKPSEVLAERDEAISLAAPAPAKAEEVVIPMPAHAQAEPVAQPAVAQPAPIQEPVQKPAPVVEPIAPAAKAEPAPVVASAPAEPETPEPFFPLEIDKNEETHLTEKVEKPEFDIPVFDAELYASGSQNESDAGGVMVKEPVVSREETQTAQPSVEPAPAVAEAPAKPKEEKSDNDDFLGGHLDLLNKLK